ncbi:MAG TPA: ribosome-associated translation inhibitor RaiA [Bacteroidetes bacterium]|nr:ribosome-associated translation inhibitor RaiA [Bacteroidota bacterium]HEX05054.1 ribosome-associated translation inhibitor RaiA [Bacteroidota bacterium]
MQVIIQGDGINVRDELKEHIEKEIARLDKYYDRLIQADVVLEGHTHQKEARVRLELPRESLFASETSDKFEISIESAVDKLVEQLKRYKEKLRDS